MNGTFEQILKAGKEACIEHGFSSIGVYQTQDEINVQDGWDRFIISPVHVSESEYKYLGFVRANGEFVGRHQTQLAPDAGDSGASSGIVNASALSTSQTDSAPTQRG